MTAVELAVFTHRELFRADLLIPKLVSRQPPTSLDVNTGVLHQEPAFKAVDRQQLGFFESRDRVRSQAPSRPCLSCSG